MRSAATAEPGVEGSTSNVRRSDGPPFHAGFRSREYPGVCRRARDAERPKGRSRRITRVRHEPGIASGNGMNPVMVLGEIASWGVAISDDWWWTAPPSWAATRTRISLRSKTRGGRWCWIFAAVGIVRPEHHPESQAGATTRFNSRKPRAPFSMSVLMQRELPQLFYNLRQLMAHCSDLSARLRTVASPRGGGPPSKARY